MDKGLKNLPQTVAVEQEDKEEPELSVSDDEDFGTGTDTAEESGGHSASEVESCASTIEANDLALNLDFHNCRRSKEDHHSGCTTHAYLYDGQDYNGDNVRRCKAVRHSTTYAA
ncbi:hypothetical protein ColTof4_06462 [Colletotrichum tofieldiae]|nr:hypothetical protein ColTof3_01657 [Colletotrichum tofieldiae]GKT74039.1 hypothetical protein ColTof4_06462 [Colletotrichum tofieldiae]